MKVIAFFSEKGGVGKTTLSVLFASWLAYCRKERVYMMDFDHPTYHVSGMREDDVRIARSMTNPVLTKAYVSSGMAPYPIQKIRGLDSYTPEQLSMTVEKIRRMKAEGDGYLVCDFPGRFLKGDPTYAVLTGGGVDLLVFMVDSDKQSVDSALYVNRVLRGAVRRAGGQRVLALWNRENQSERSDERSGRRDWYAAHGVALAEAGIPVLGQRMHDIAVMRRNEDSLRFVRSTLCWPEQNIAVAFGGGKDREPYIYGLFEEIRSALDAVPEI